MLDLGDLLLRQLHQPHQLLGAAAQHLSFLRQGDSPVAALKQRHAEFFLQILHLPRQGGLGDVQGLGGCRDRALTDHREKVLHRANVHIRPSSSFFLCNYSMGKHRKQVFDYR